MVTLMIEDHVNDKKMMMMQMMIFMIMIVGMTIERMAMRMLLFAVIPHLVISCPL